jgi:hypothetical protein
MVIAKFDYFTLCNTQTQTISILLYMSFTIIVDQAETKPKIINQRKREPYLRPPNHNQK